MKSNITTCSFPSFGSLRQKYYLAAYIDRYTGKTKENGNYLSSITIIKCFYENSIL